MISKKRYWGLALPIYDCSACGTVEVIGGREELQRAGGRGLGGVRGPHAAPAVGRRGDDRLPVVRRPGRAHQATSATPGSTPGSCRSRRSTTARTRTYWAQWFPADFITESFPGQFRNWFYSMLAMSTVLRREPPFKTIFGYALRLRRGRPADAQELGQRDRLRRGRRADGRRRHALDVREGAARGEHPLRLARRRRGAPRAAGPVERLRVLRDVRPAGGLDARRGRRRRRSPSGGALDRWILSRAAGHGGRGRGAPARLRRASAATRELSRVHRRPVDLVPAPVARADSRATTTRPTAPRRSRRSTRRSSATARMLAPILPFLSEAMYGNLVDRRAGPARTASTSRAGRRPTWPRTATRASRRRWRSRRTRWTWPGRCAARPGSGPASRWPTPGWPCPDRGLDVGPELLALIADEINVKAGRGHRRRLRPGRAARQAAAAEDRQAARVARSRP